MRWRRASSKAYILLYLTGRRAAHLLTASIVFRQYRGKHDMQSAVGGGFVAGAFLARRNGSKAMLLGGAGFAGFSWAIEHFWIQKPPADDDNGFFVC